MPRMSGELARHEISEILGRPFSERNLMLIGDVVSLLVAVRKRETENRMTADFVKAAYLIGEGSDIILGRPQLNSPQVQFAINNGLVDRFPDGEYSRLRVLSHQAERVAKLIQWHESLAAAN